MSYFRLARTTSHCRYDLAVSQHRPCFSDTFQTPKWGHVDSRNVVLMNQPSSSKKVPSRRIQVEVFNRRGVLTRPLHTPWPQKDDSLTRSATIFMLASYAGIVPREVVVCVVLQDYVPFHDDVFDPIRMQWRASRILERSVHRISCDPVLCLKSCATSLCI